MLDYTLLNEQIAAWHAKVKKEVRSATASKTKHVASSSSPKPLSQRIGGKQVKKFGVTERLSITFPRHMVFREKKVGRGRPAGSQAPDPIVNPVIERNIAELADIAGNGLADVYARNMFID
jgi:hypothetical protein